MFHSVVGKLWITIVVLVAAVFLFLSIFLIEYFDRYYYVEQSDDLNNLGNKLMNIIQDSSQKELALSTAEEIVATFDANMTIVSRDENGGFSSATSLFSAEDLTELYENKRNVIRLNNQSYKDFITFSSVNDILAMAIPIEESGISGRKNEVIILYQTLNNLYKTTSDIKKIILLFAGIGIIFTTIFTFFLSSRITAPLRQIQQAALRMSKGDFKTRVHIKSTDEIGDLANGFNQMANQLDENVKALSSEKEKLSNILNSMADGVMTTDTRGEVMITNPPAEIILKNINEEGYILPDQLKKITKKALVEKKVSEKDITLSGRIYSVKMTPLLFGNQINGFVTLFRDVTYERKLDKLRKDFLANVSHELRTPISMLQGYSEAIIDDIAESPEEKKELAQIIYDESLRMGRLVNELLDLIKMETGHFQLQYCKTSIEFLVNKMVRKFATLAQELDVKLVNEIYPIHKTIYMDADRIEQVLTNLIDNALRHTKKGGNIIIRAELQQDERLLIEVEDSGVGIPEEDLPFVFERFYKADKARTRGQAGTGLGLSIVKNIVDAHAGTITVTSKVNHGTTFSILLPTDPVSKH